MPKVVDHDRYRKELLSQCLALFAEQGYGSVTMRQIAQRLGVSTGTLYHYFPSKEGIFAQLVEELYEQNLARFFAEAPAEGTVGDRLRVVMTLFLEHYRFYQQHLLLWVGVHQHNQQQATGDRRFIHDLWQRTHAPLTAYLGLPPEHVDFILVVMDGLLLQCIYDRGESEQEWIAQQTELLIRLLESAA